MNDLDTLGDAKAAAFAIYRAAMDEYEWRTVRESSDTEWDGEALALEHLALLEQVTGTPTWVKHENATPTGAFKVRGGLVFAERLLRQGAAVPGLISATRGNHGQSVAFAGREHGIPVTIVVPEGNSPDKNASMAAWGAELIVYGRDFQESLEHARALADEHGLVFVPSFHPDLVAGIATAAVELHTQAGRLDVVYVPVGQGSGICAQIAARDLLGADTEIVGVVSENAPAHALSFEAGRPISTPTAR